MTDDCKRANVTFKMGKSDLPQCLREQIHMETIHVHMKDKKAIGNKKHGSTKGKQYLASLTALSDAMICSVE